MLYGVTRMKAFWAITLAACLAWGGGASKPVDLTLADSSGARVHLRDLRGKIVVLNFWATWCGPCKAEMPMIAAMEREYRSRGVAFLAISLDDVKTQRRIPEFVKEHGITFPVWKGATSSDLDRLDLGEAVPATAFVNREGRVAARILGQMAETELKERLEWLLGDGFARAPKAFVRHLDH